MKKLCFMLLCAILVGCQGKDTALFSAAHMGNTQAVKKLIATGANVNFNEGQGWTPLMIATAEDHEETVKILLENGAHPNAQNQYGRTALHYAANYTLEPIVKLLLDYGADPTIQTYQNFGDQQEPGTPIDAALNIFANPQHRTHAEQQAAYNILKMFIYKTGQANVQYEGITPLALANRYQDKEFQNYLLSKGAKRPPQSRRSK